MVCFTALRELPPTRSISIHTTEPTVARESFRRLLRAGTLDDTPIEVAIPERQPQGGSGGPSGQFGEQLNQVLSSIDPGLLGLVSKPKRRKLPVRDALPLLVNHFIEELLDESDVEAAAVLAAETDGIVFIDEIDKIIESPSHRSGADASSEGVQRDLLPLIEVSCSGCCQCGWLLSIWVVVDGGYRC